MLVGIVVRYTLLYINSDIMGVLSLNCCLMGPPPRYSRLCIGKLVCIVTSFLLGFDTLSLCSNLGMPHNTAGAQHLVSEPRGAILAYRRLGSNTQRRTARVAPCARWARIVGPNGRSRWLICSILRHAMCSDSHRAMVQTTGGSEDKWRNESVHS